MLLLQKVVRLFVKTVLTHPEKYHVGHTGSILTQLLYMGFLLSER